MACRLAVVHAPRELFGENEAMVLNASDWLTDYLRGRAKVIILTFFTYAALC
jgi:hypothetical protein